MEFGVRHRIPSVVGCGPARRPIRCLTPNSLHLPIDGAALLQLFGGLQQLGSAPVEFFAALLLRVDRGASYGFALFDLLLHGFEFGRGFGFWDLRVLGMRLS